MIFLRQSTASQEVPLGRFVDSTDGNTEETALTINNTDIKLWKTGATTLASKNSGGATHIANGVYYATLDATDTDTIGPMTIHIHVSGALYVKQDCCVLDEAVYDVLFGTTAPSTYAGADTSGTTTLLSRIGGAITITSGRVNADVTHIATAAVSTSTAQLGVNVVNFGGSAGTFASGIPSVNTAQISGDSVAADNLESAADGTGYNLGGGSIVAASVTGAVGSVTGAVGSVTGAVGSVTGNVGGNVVGSVGSISGVTFPTNFSATLIGSDGTLRANIERTGTAQAGASTTITLDSGASAVDNYYKHSIVRIVSGTGAGQSRLITSYVGSTKVATIESGHNWNTNPDNTSVFDIIAGSSVDIQSWAGTAVQNGLISGGSTLPLVNAYIYGIKTTNTAGMLNNLLADYDGTGYAGGTIPRNVNATQISGDGTAADNAEAFFDGTGYAGTNNVIPTVTTLTGHTPQTGDSFARLGAPAGASVSADIAAVAADLPTKFTKNVAISNFTFPMRNTSDVLTTGLTVTGTISKDGGAPASLGGTIAEVGSGLYKIDTISSTEMNANNVVLTFAASGAKSTVLVIVTQPT